MTMRRFAILPIFALSMYSISTFSMEVVKRCEVGAGKNHTIELLHDHPIDSTSVFYLRKDGSTPHRIYPGEEDQSRGDVSTIRVDCAGGDEHVFVLSGEFSLNYLQGVAIRYNNNLKYWQRIDFSERERPMAVSLSPTGMTVLIPNTGKNESPKRFIIYKYKPGKDGNSRPTYSDRLPEPERKLIRIPAH